MLLARSLKPASRNLMASRTSLVHRHLSASPHQQAMDHADAQIVAKEDNPLAVMTLNRPKALNALNLEMMEQARPLLRSWETSNTVKLILLRGNGRAFCAGGDVVAITNASKDPETRNSSADFFQSEYSLDNFISKMKTPVVSFMDGITMGGGVGLSVHNPFRVATEKTVFAMPETTIGLFPDVGASFFLPRLDGKVGLYLGLTSNRLSGWGALQTGIATHCIPSAQLDEVEERLSKLEFTGHAPDHDVINNVLNEYSVDEPLDFDFDLVGMKRKAIDDAFSKKTILEIVQRLREYESHAQLGSWAKGTADTIEFRSPTSCVVALSAYKEGAKMNIDEVFRMDMQLGSRFCDPTIAPDFVNGVEHVLIKKDRDNRAAWNPSSLNDLNENDVYNRFFAKTSPNTENPVPVPEIDQGFGKPYAEYPHREYGLPAESDIEKVVKGEAKRSGSHALTEKEVLNFILRDAKTTGGLKAKVLEVLSRKTKKGEAGTLQWIYED